jgi:hypothetical protein
VPGPDGMAVGESESPRMLEEFRSGVRPEPPLRPKGPKPIIGWKPEDEDGGPDGGDAPTDPPQAASATTTAMSADERRARWRVTGPERPEDAWKWEGVPAGRSLMGPVEPGKMRYYMGDDGHGPQIRCLDPAWPPGQEPEDEE